MNLMTSEAALRLPPAAEPANTAPDVLFFGVGDTALGKIESYPHRLLSLN